MLFRSGNESEDRQWVTVTGTIDKEFYPEFFFKEISLEDLKRIPLEELKYPFVIKPSMGFFSVGVHVVHNDEDWKRILASIDAEMEAVSSAYPEDVVTS